MTFTDADLDRLEAYLQAEHRIDAALPIDAIQGLFAAIASTTDIVPREKWLPEVLGESHAFESPEDAEAILDVLERFREATARQLHESEGFDFILYGPEGDDEDLAAWADGYLIGVELADPRWNSERPVVSRSAWSSRTLPGRIARIPRTSTTSSIPSSC